MTQRFPVITPASDVYAFGLLMLEVLSGSMSKRSSQDILNGEVANMGWWTDRTKYFLTKPVFLHRYDLNYNNVLVNCLCREPELRPKMSDVERALNAAFAQACGDYDLFTANRSPLSVYCRATTENDWNDATTKLPTLRHLEYNARGPINSTRKFVAPIQSLLMPHAHSFSEKMLEVLPETLNMLFAPRLVIAGEKLPGNLTELWIGSLSDARTIKEGSDDGSEPQPTRPGIFDSSSSAVSDAGEANNRNSKTIELPSSSTNSSSAAPSPAPLVQVRKGRSASAAPAVKSTGTRAQLISRAFPPLLRVVSVEDLDITTLDVSCLPKEVEWLRAGARSVENALDAALMPRTLTALSLPGVTRVLGPSTALPPNLTLLCLSSANVDSTWLENLPKSLKWLDIRSAPNPPNDADSWPLGLEYLDISSCSITAPYWAIMSEILEKLATLKVKRFVLPSPHLNPPPPALAPPSLTHFEWTDGSGSVPQALFSHILPDELKHLEFPNADFEGGVQKIFSSLPPALQTLIIPKVKQVVDTHIHLLPRGITHLSMAGATSLTDVGVRRLPRALVYLDLSSSPGITDEVAPWLPDTITHLDLAAAVNWKNPNMKYLPRNLLSLNLASAVGLTQDCIGELPRTLVSFKASNSGINAHFFRNGK